MLDLGENVTVIKTNPSLAPNPVIVIKQSPPKKSENTSNKTQNDKSSPNLLEINVGFFLFKDMKTELFDDFLDKDILKDLAELDRQIDEEVAEVLLEISPPKNEPEIILKSKIPEPSPVQRMAFFEVVNKVKNPKIDMQKVNI